jgi:pimeloyl-ACP methyl ester carboxylesterase
MTDLQSHRFAGRDGLKLAYLEAGEGRPLVLLHGFLASGRQWIDHGPAATLIEKGCRLIIPDLRGHGDSARPHDPSSYPPDVLADDGFALLEQLGLDDYDLGGYSLGGNVVLRMLARGAKPAQVFVAAQGLTAITNSVPRGKYQRVLTAIVEGEPIAPSSPDAEAAHWITQLGGDPLALLQVLNSLVATPPGELGQISTPVLVVVGDEDHDHRSAEELATVLLNALFTRVVGNHWTTLTGPEFAATLVGFLTRSPHSPES